MQRRGVFTAGGVGQVAIALGATILIAGCPADPGTMPDPLAVNAGADQAGTTGDTFTLNAGASVTGGTNPVPEWTIVGPSSPAIVNAGSVNGASVTIGVAGSYTATLGALDANNNFAADSMVITVTDPPPPVITVDAGADKAANGGDAVNLTALTSGDTPPTSFSWQLTSAGSAGTVNLTNANSQTATATFSQDAEGTFTFLVSVSDSAAPTPGAGSDSVDVVVTASPDPANTIFTLNLDSLVGTSGDDAFIAPPDLVAGAQAPTLQTADSADGMGGNDTLTAFIPGNAALTVQPNLTGIGMIHIQNTLTNPNLFTLNANTSTGISHVASDNSISPVSVTNLAALADAAITNNAQNLTLGFQAAATTGAADTLNLSLSNTTAAGGTFTFNSGGTNGIETLNVDSTGAENSATLVQGGGGNTLTTINTTGDQKVTLLGALPGTVTTLSAAGQSGGGTVASATATVFTFTGGPGDDGINFGATFVATGATADSADGGAGTDTIGFTSAAAGGIATAITNANNFEILEVTDALANNVDATLFNLNSTVNLPAGFGGVNTLSVANGDTVVLGSSALGIAGADGTANGTINVNGIGVNDAVTVQMNDHDTSSALIFTGIESVALVSNINVTGAAADGGLNNIGGALTCPGTTPLVITGDEDLTVVGVTTAASIDASGLPATVNLTLTGTATATTVTGGAGNDTLTTSDAVAETIDAGAGNDTIDAGTGVGVSNVGDIITTGDGADILTYTTLTDSLNTNMDVLQDFTSGADSMNVPTPPTTLGSGTVGPDLNTATTASTGVTTGTLATDLATAVAAAGANVFDQAGDTLIVTLTGNSIGGTNAVYVVIEDGTTLTTYDAAEDFVALLTGTSSTTLAIADFQ